MTIQRIILKTIIFAVLFLSPFTSHGDFNNSYYVLSGNLSHEESWVSNQGMCWVDYDGSYINPIVTLTDSEHFNLAMLPNPDEPHHVILTVTPKVPTTPGKYFTGINVECGGLAPFSRTTMHGGAEINAVRVPTIEAFKSPSLEVGTLNKIEATVSATSFMYNAGVFYQASIDGGNTWVNQSDFPWGDGPIFSDYGCIDDNKTINSCMDVLQTSNNYAKNISVEYWQEYPDNYTVYYDGQFRIALEPPNALKHKALQLVSDATPPITEIQYRLGYQLRRRVPEHQIMFMYYGPPVALPVDTPLLTASTIPPENPPRKSISKTEELRISWDLKGYGDDADTKHLFVGLRKSKTADGPVACITEVEFASAGTVNLDLDRPGYSCQDLVGLGPWYPWISANVTGANYGYDNPFQKSPNMQLVLDTPYFLGDVFEENVPGVEDDILKGKKTNPPGMVSCPPSSVGDPVDLLSGRFYSHRSLMNVQGAIPLEFSLSYSAFNPADRGAGFGWSHNFQTSLRQALVRGSCYKNPDGSVSCQSYPGAEVTWPGGRVTLYTENGDGSTFSSETGDPQDKLTRHEDNSWTLVDKQRNTSNFNAAGQLVEFIDRFGNRLSLTYVSNQLDRVTEPLSGRYLQFAYDGNGRIANVSSLGAGTVAFAYDTNGDLATVTDALGNSTNFTYDAAHQLLTETDPAGNTVVSNSYDVDGRVIKQSDASGNTSASFSYQPFLVSYDDALGNQTNYVIDVNGIRQQTGPTGKLTQHTYDAAGKRIGEVDPLGGSSSFTYDADGYLTSRTDPLGNTTNFSYDANHNLTSITDALAHVTTYEYDASNRLIKKTDAKGQETVRTYSADGQLETVTDPAGGVTTYAYTAGMLTSVKDPTNRTTTFSYDAAGRLLTTTNPLNQTTTYTYDLKGNRLSETNPDGRTTSYAYDANGNLLTVTDPLNRVTIYTYDSRNNRITETNPLNQVTTHSYDAANRLVSTTDAGGNVTTYSYDGAGLLVNMQRGGLSQYRGYDGGGRLSYESGFLGNFSYQYDALGRLTGVYDGVYNATHYNYDSVGNRTSAVDPLGHTTSYSYDTLNRVIGVQDALGGNSSQGFSSLGLRTALQDAGGVATSFSHDAAGRLTGITVDGAHTGLTYDAAGRLATKTNARGQTATYTYTAAGLLTGISDPVGTIAISYDAAGNLLSTTDPAGTFTATSDGLDRLTSYTDVYGNTIGYSYDAAGNLAQLTYPDNKVVTYSYTSAGLLASVTDWASRTTGYSYDANGRLSQVDNADGTTVKYAYDNAGRVTEILTLAPDNSERQRLGYTYDAGGRISNESGLPILPLDDPAVMTYTGNRLASYKGEPVSHDADGNMTSGPLAGGIGNYSYDARGRLTKAGNTGYTYDAADRRVAVNAAGSITRLVVDPNAALPKTLMETDQNGTPIAWYVYGLGLVGRQNSAGDYHTYHYDLRGSTLALTDSNGEVTDSYQYGLYGQLVGGSGSTPNPFRYNGRDGVHTDSNGLYHMRARYYQPEAKRFVSLDPLLGSMDDVAALNRYAYVGGDPVRFVDPTGLFKAGTALIGAAKITLGVCTGLLLAPNPLGAIAAGIIIADGLAEIKSAFEDNAENTNRVVGSAEKNIDLESFADESNVNSDSDLINTNNNRCGPNPDTIYYCPQMY